MTDDRFSRLLDNVLDDLAPRRIPDYLDEVLARTAHTRQRPAWTFPERWFPMVAIARPALLPGRSPLLILIVVAALLAALAIAVVGSRQQRLPPPTGPAGNGLIAYDAGADIFVFDPATGQSRALLEGPERDYRPVWSMDGTRIAFLREIEIGGGWAYHTVRADGTGLVQVTPSGMALNPIVPVFWSPDGTSVLFQTASSIYLAQADGSGIERLNPADLRSDSPAWKPDGTQVLFRGGIEGSYGLYVINVDGSGLRLLRGGQGGAIDYSVAAFSPDGTRIAYHERSADTKRPAVHAMNADGSADRVVVGATSEAVAPAWSPDGTRLLYAAAEGSPEVWRLLVIAADGSQGPVAVSPTFGHFTAIWSPDGQQIVATFDDPPNVYLLDPAGGEPRLAAFRGDLTERGAWQRVAP